MRQAKHQQPVEQPIECRIGRNPEAGKVLMAYNRKIDNVSFAPAAAVETAKALLEEARALDPTSVQGVSW